MQRLSSAPPRVIVAGYLALQSIAVTGWWILLAAIPRAASWFQPESWPREALLAFWLADLGLLALGSAFTAAAVARGSPWASRLVWALAAASWYPALYCVGVGALTGEGWIAASLMVAMAGLTLAMATIHGTESQTPAAIRATPMAASSAVLWTLAQTSVFWGSFLWVLPLGIVEVEGLLSWTRFEHGGQRAGAAVLFVLSSALGLASGVTMARRGRGTPLPTATAPELVTAGPYSLLRNPMATAGICQGLAVGWGLGSRGVLLYAMAGAVAWHVFVRPVEERDLWKRFGASYEAYRERAGLWIPRWPQPAAQARPER